MVKVQEFFSPLEKQQLLMFRDERVRNMALEEAAQEIEKHVGVRNSNLGLGDVIRQLKTDKKLGE